MTPSDTLPCPALPCNQKSCRHLRLPFPSPQGSKAVKDEIVNYDAHKITLEMRARVAKLMESKGNSFEQAVGEVMMS